MSSVAQFVESKLKKIVPMVKPLNQLPAVACHICENLFLPSNTVVYDYDHFIGDFKDLLISFGYDAHLIVQNIAKSWRVSLLPINKERYMYIIYPISWRLLDELVSTLAVKDMTILKKQFPNLADEHFNLLTRKGCSVMTTLVTQQN
nr:unnamed protein product [Callosobruchus chinensis]